MFRKLRLYGDLSAEAPFHSLHDSLPGQVAAEQIIELRDGRLRRDIISADRAGAFQRGGSFVGSKGYRSVVTLGADNDHGAVFAGSPDHRQQGVRGSRDIAGAERFD